MMRVGAYICIYIYYKTLFKEYYIYARGRIPGKNCRLDLAMNRLLKLTREMSTGKEAGRSLVGVRGGSV